MDRSVTYRETSNYQHLNNLELTKHLEILDPITLCCCGIERCNPKDQFGPAVRSFYIIHVVLSGEGFYKVGEKNYRLGAGQAFLIRPGEETLYQTGEENPWTYTWIGFSGYKASAIVKEMGFTKEEYVIDLENCQRIQESVNGIIKSRGLSYVSELRRKSKFYETLTYLIEGNEKNNQERKEREREELRKKYVRSATEYIMAFYNKKIRISELANEIGLNRSYLTYIFKQEMNMSPQDFLINFRLEKAAMMLRETNDSVRTIARNTGYEDSLLFSKSFKQKYKMTPTEFRNTQIRLVETKQEADRKEVTE